MGKRKDDKSSEKFLTSITDPPLRQHMEYLDSLRERGVRYKLKPKGDGYSEVWKISS